MLPLVLRRIALILILLAGIAATLLGAPDSEVAQDEAPRVLMTRLENEAISPVIVQFLQRAIQQAGQQEAECLVIMLDTPGGLVDSTRVLVKEILGSGVPVVVYVAPAGSRAASAGLFITLASHVAVMAPGTTIGAAHPVQIGGLPAAPDPDQRRERKEQDEKKDEKGEDEAEQQRPRARTPMEEKIVEDTMSWARALAERRGRNAEWASQEAVKNSRSVHAAEAMELNVVDLLAENLDELLEKIDGREVVLPDETRTLRTKNARVETISMWWGERVLSVIARPNVAFLLLIAGFYGLMFELYNPGWGLVGTMGLVCLLLGLTGMAILPINYLGLALIALALALLVAEVFVTSFGLLTVAGTICLVVGALMLVESPTGFEGVALGVAVPVAVATAIITLFLVGGVLRTFRTPAQTGGEEMVGLEAQARSDFRFDEGKYRGTVFAHGELWSAISEKTVKTGQTCQVRGREGLTLLVEPAENPARAT